MRKPSHVSCISGRKARMMSLSSWLLVQSGEFGEAQKEGINYRCDRGYPMNFRRMIHLFTLAALFSFGLSVPAHAETPEPYPLEYWALRDVVTNVELSPEGDRLALLKIPSREGDPVLEVHDASDLSKEPFRVNADPMEIIGFNWVSNSVIAFVARQVVRKQIEGWNQGVYEFQFALLDVESREIRNLDQDGEATIDNLLPGKPNHFIVAVSGVGGDDGPSARVQGGPRSTSYWEYNIKRGTRKLLIRGKPHLGNIRFDANGNPVHAEGFDRRTGEFIWYYRTEDDRWEEYYRLHEDKWEQFSFAGIDDENPDLVYVIATNGDDTSGLWLFNVKTREFVEPVYHREDVDVVGLVGHSNYWGKPEMETGVVWSKDKRYIEYWDDEEAAIQAQLERVIEHSYNLDFWRSRDGQTFLIFNVGPRDPGTYYLLKDGNLQVIGSQQPLLASEQLADVRYITYEARDGRKIPAYITTPNAEPPYPLVVMPHGGPFISEHVSYDEWAQMLANNGYLVLQPQYRGSLSYGMEFHQSAFIDGGQGGYKMQDDKDDGALYLVEQGLADPDRMAMYGWSYGGYAALVAASRTPQIYQCVIAGAAVSDTNLQLNYYRYALRGAQRVSQLNMWDESISPIEEVEKVNVPMLLVHGSVDQRVPPDHVALYIDELERHGKPFKYVELEGADHFYNTLFYDHQLKLYTSMLDYLQNDCGPGGL